MVKLLLAIARVSGIVGVVTAGLSVALRLTGRYEIRGVETGTIMQSATTAMVLACLAYLVLQVERTHKH